jgi:hypothetical protein
MDLVSLVSKSDQRLDQNGLRKLVVSIGDDCL